MRIDNNYTQYRQPNFGRLKSIQYGKNYYPDVYPEETARLLRTIKESKAFNEFFKQYDADYKYSVHINLYGSELRKRTPRHLYRSNEVI